MLVAMYKSSRRHTHGYFSDVNVWEKYKNTKGKYLAIYKSLKTLVLNL